ncbi:MAG: DJ-1/PfpI family protein, partial [Bacteroidota bacterium]
LMAEGVIVEVIAPRAVLSSSKNKAIPVDKTLMSVASVLYDAVYVPGGQKSVVALAEEADAIHFLNEAFKHCKPIAASSNALQVIEQTYFAKKLPKDSKDATVVKEGVVVGDAATVAKQFLLAIQQHRFWEREKLRKVPA